MVTSPLRYRSDLGAADDRVAALPARTVTLPAGSVEHLDDGDGPAVLLVHGDSGGHDAALRLADPSVSWAADGWRRPASGTSAR